MDFNHDTDSSSDDETALLSALESIVGDIAEFESRIGPRWRRTVRALHGLGLLDVVGRDWVRITPDGFSFGHLTPAQADRLARRLEDLENGMTPPAPTLPPPDHPTLDLPQPIVPPTAGISEHHFGAWR